MQIELRPLNLQNLLDILRITKGYLTMGERIFDWCYHCGHKSSFEKKGTCIKNLNIYSDEDFPVLIFLGTDEYGIDTETIVDRYELQENGGVTYTFEKKWTLMQCTVCLQPTLMENGTLYRQDHFRDEIDTYGLEFDPDKVYPENIAPEQYTLYPAIKIGATPAPHEKMPLEVVKLFNEARTIFGNSPKSSAALLRLALEALLTSLKIPGKSIHQKIGSLFASDLLTERTIQACDCIRLMGNEGVHIGEINLAEGTNIALDMFNVINYIIEDIDTIKKIEKMYANIPKTKKDEIEKRNKEAKEKRNENLPNSGTPS